MRISMDLNMFSDFSLEEAIRLTKEAGYDLIELHPRSEFLPAFMTPHVSANQIASVKRWLREYSVKVDSILLAQLICSASEAERQTAVASVRRILEVAAELQCRRFTSELNGHPGSWRCRAAFRHSMEELLPVLEREDFHISFECHPGDFIEDSNATVDLIREFNSSHIGYLFCCPHIFTMGNHVKTMVEYAGPTITHVHIADSFRQERIIKDPPDPTIRVHLHLKPGLGEVDWPTFFTALRAVGYDGTLSVVTFSHRDRALETAKETREWLTQYIG